jgi:hypothetical protein
MASNEVLVSSRNLFIDTNRGDKSAGTRGDKYEVDLNTEAIHLDEGQFLRLTLKEFNMYKNWTNVNDNNRKFLIHGTQNGTDFTTNVFLDAQNYEVLTDLADNVAEKIATILDAETSLTHDTITNVKPPGTAGINGTSDNIISFTINYLSDPSFSNLKITFPETFGEAYALLGGNRASTADNSGIDGWDVTISGISNEIITFTGYYPAQRSTTSNIYLRTSLNTKASESASLTSDIPDVQHSAVQQSNILAKIPVNSEFCQFNSNTGREYFIDINQKYLTHFRIYLTDEHNRPIARALGSSANTPNFKALSYSLGSDGDNQSILGNLNFNCVLRADVLQQRKPREAFTEPYQNPTQARQNGLLVNPSLPPY